MNRIVFTVVTMLLLASTNDAVALRIFACEPEWASLSQELSGELNQIESALTVLQDPHRLQAKPSLIATIRKVDLLVCSGADLELGWLPLLLRRSSNRHIQVGQQGHFEASAFIRRLEIPKILDRALGDLHPQGNPHVHLDPRNIRVIAKALTKRLIALDPDNAHEYGRLQEDFQRRWRIALTRWNAQAKALKGQKIITHHTSFSYLINWLKMDRIATIETKPGIAPSSAHLSSLLKTVTANPPRYLLRTPYANSKPSKWLSEKTGIEMLVLPYSVGENHTAKNLFELFDVTLSLLLDKT